MMSWSSTMLACLSRFSREASHTHTRTQKNQKPLCTTFNLKWLKLNLCHCGRDYLPSRIAVKGTPSSVFMRITFSATSWPLILQQ